MYFLNFFLELHLHSDRLGVLYSPYFLLLFFLAGRTVEDLRTDKLVSGKCSNTSNTNSSMVPYGTGITNITLAICAFMFNNFFDFLMIV